MSGALFREARRFRMPHASSNASPYGIRFEVILRPLNQAVAGWGNGERAKHDTGIVSPRYCIGRRLRRSVSRGFPPSLASSALKFMVLRTGQQLLHCMLSTMDISPTGSLRPGSLAPRDDLRPPGDGPKTCSVVTAALFPATNDPASQQHAACSMQQTHGRQSRRAQASIGHQHGYSWRRIV